MRSAFAKRRAIFFFRKTKFESGYFRQTEQPSDIRRIDASGYIRYSMVFDSVTLKRDLANLPPRANTSRGRQRQQFISIS